ncbi:MAG: RNA polymerase sigma factor, partial [Planctomycetota bacterium]
GSSTASSSSPSGIEPLDQEASPVERAQVSELGEHIHDSLQRLSPKLRAILVLRYLESLSYEELAQTLEISMGTVKSRLARAHIALEKVLKGTLTPFGYPELDADADSGGEGVA